MFIMIRLRAQEVPAMPLSRFIPFLVLWVWLQSGLRLWLGLRLGPGLRLWLGLKLGFGLGRRERHGSTTIRSLRKLNNT